MEVCAHCSEIARPPFYREEDLHKETPFCCFGCLTVYNILHLKGLESYYEIKEAASKFKRRSPVEFKKTNFEYLDNSEFLEEYSYSFADNEKVMDFYLEGIHCLACLWLIEKLPELVPGGISARLDIDRSVVRVVLNQNGKFSLVARELNQLGYRPHPLKRNQTTTDLKRKEERTNLIRIGLSGAAAGNIMIYAVSLYGGASGEFAWVFNLLTVVFGIPVFTFCAFPFYQNAWNALRNKNVSIDIPISVALLIGAGMGLYNFFVGINENYFDSLTTLVFLLLLSRYFLQKIQEKGFSSQDLSFFYQSESVLRLEEGEFVEIHPKFLRPQDVIKIKENEIIPADSIVLEGTSYVNNSLLTGESFPIKVMPEDKVFSGTQNLDHEIVLKVEKVLADTRLGQILKSVENGWSYKSKFVGLIGQISKYFTLVVFALAAILFVYRIQDHSLKHALELSITLLIVTCPCALALAIPLTLTKSLSRASQFGIVIKNDEVLERISQARRVFLDKTGTLTYGKLSVAKFHSVSEGAIPVYDVIHNLEKRSIHPAGMALKKYVKEKNPRDLEVFDLKEIPGRGVEGYINKNFYEINKLGVFENGKLVAEFSFEDALRENAAIVVKKIIDRGIEVKILSGDKQEVVDRLAKELNLVPSAALGDLSPEEKSKIIRDNPGSIMLGDGANDAIALGHASVGVAVNGSMDIALRVADVYLSVPGLESVEQLFVLSEETMKVVKRNFILSIAYNSISIVATFAGLIDPLVAAIIMPVSSLTVLFSTMIGTKKMRNLWKS